MRNTRVFRFITIHGPVDIELAYKPVDLTPLHEAVERLDISDPKVKRKLDAKVAEVIETTLDRALLLSALDH